MDGENNQTAPKQHRKIGFLPIILMLLLVGVIVLLAITRLAISFIFLVLVVVAATSENKWLIPLLILIGIIVVIAMQFMAPIIGNDFINTYPGCEYFCP